MMLFDLEKFDVGKFVEAVRESIMPEKYRSVMYAVCGKSGRTRG